MSRTVRVVIVGGGFAGLYAAAHLARSDLGERAAITLVDRGNYFTFTPLLPEVAAGTFGREHVIYPHRVLARRYGYTFVQAVAEGLDLDAQVLVTRPARLPFDYLLLAVGAEPRYFGNESLRRWSLPLTSVPEALAIRDRVIRALEQASVTTDPGERARLTTCVVAGAGPAGVEIASEIRHLANDVLRPYYGSILPMRVILMDPGDRILTGFDARLAAEGLQRLRRRGVDVRLGSRIEQAGPGQITARSGSVAETVAAGLFIWTAGSGPVAWAATLPFPSERGALRVLPTLQIDGQENIFAVGDVTTLTDPRTGTPYPRVAPIAISQGVRAAANIENHALHRPLEPYQAYHAGKIVSLGDGTALVDVLGTLLTGRLAWWIYRTAYLLKLVGMKNKVHVLTTLALHRLFGPDISGEAAAENYAGAPPSLM